MSEKKKGFLARIMERIDRKLVEKSKKGCCCEDKKDSKCCR